MNNTGGKKIEIPMSEFKKILRKVKNIDKKSFAKNMWKDINNLLKLRIGIIVGIIVGIAIYALVMVYLAYKTEQSKDIRRMQFTHTVIWGNAGTDGCFLFLGKTFAQFFMIFLIIVAIKSLISTTMEAYEAAPDE